MNQRGGSLSRRIVRVLTSSSVVASFVVVVGVRGGIARASAPAGRSSFSAGPLRLRAGQHQASRLGGGRPTGRSNPLVGAFTGLLRSTPALGGAVGGAPPSVKVASLSRPSGAQ